MSLKMTNVFKYLNIEAKMAEQPATLSRAEQVSDTLKNNHRTLSLTSECAH